MANFLSSLFGGKKATSQPAVALRVNTSLQGVVRALVLGGSQRVGGNLIDYYNFNYQNAPSASSGGGKGGLTGSGSGKGSSGQYVYYVTFALAHCEGPIAAIDGFMINGSAPNGNSLGGSGAENTLPGANPPINYEFFFGDYAQNPSTYTGTVKPANALAYRGLCYTLFENFPLGSSPSLPNITVLVRSTITWGAIPGQPDGDPSVAFAAFLTNPHGWSVGFPATRLGSLALWQGYCLALGLVMSPVIASPVVASAWCTDITKATNAEPCWQNGLLTVVPYGDAAVTLGQVSSITEGHVVPAGLTPYGNFPQIKVGNAGTFAGDRGVSYSGGGALTRVSVYAPTGVPITGSPGPGQYFVSGGVYFFNPSDINQTVNISYDWAASAAYTPNTVPLYDFTLDDFLENQSSIGAGAAPRNTPLLCSRKPRDQMLNNIKARYLDRNNNYNPVTIEQKDEASINEFGRERPSDVKQLDFFCLGSAAQQSILLSLIREQNACTFQFTVGRHFLLILELMAIVTVTDPGQGLSRQPVRIKAIAENPDFSLTVTAEEFLGTVSAPQYGAQATTPFALNYNADPGAINPPIIFEATDELSQTNGLGGLQIWGAVSGVNDAAWGGCFVWASYDGVHYARVGEIFGPARMGVLSAPLPGVAQNPVGQTIDQASTLSVNLTESGGVLASGTVLDAVALNTRCYVGTGAGEIVSYETANLAAPNQYNLSYLVRGGYGSPIGSHAAGAPFARLDQGIFEFAYDQSRIGAQVYFKFQSFNIYQGGLQSLANCPAYPYTITGSALSSPLPDIVNLRTAFDLQSGFTMLDWDEVTDFRPVSYEIRSGASAAAGMTLGTVAHPPFRVPGDGTYWVAARTTPVAGLTVYSQDWETVTIAGAVLTQNVIKTVDLKALNWPGKFTGGAGIDTGLNAIRTGGGNILTDPSVLTTPDMLNYGAGTSLAGSYYPDDNAYLDIGYVASASVAMKFQPTGVPVGQNILALGNVLTDPDILGAANTRFVNNYPLIDTATAAGGVLYSVGDLYIYPDLYVIAGANWNGFQRFTPGTYQTRFLYFRFDLSTVDPATISYDLAWTITITIPARVDTYALTTSASADTTITFQPTGAASPAAFNGGGGPGNLPAITWGIVNAAAGDDLIITALSLSAISFKILNGGSRVVRNLNLFAEGF